MSHRPRPEYSRPAAGSPFVRTRPATPGAERTEPTYSDPNGPPGRAFAATFDDATCLPGLRARIRGLLRGAERELLVDAELVCTELVTNAVEHAAGPRAVRVAVAGQDLRIEVDDASPDATLTPGVSRLGGVRGRGLAIVDAVTRWGIRRSRSRKTVWAALPLAG